MRLSRSDANGGYFDIVLRLQPQTKQRQTINKPSSSGGHCEQSVWTRSINTSKHIIIMEFLCNKLLMIATNPPTLHTHTYSQRIART